MVFALFTLPIQVKAESKEKQNAMQTYVEAMQPGWNLGNTFDATGAETSWGNPSTTKEFIAQIAAAGYKSIRIPITWKHRMGVEPDYIIDKVFMDRIQEVVDWSLEAGLYVMINLHHDSSWVFNMASEHDEVMARFNAAWSQISKHFKGYSHKLMFESINEPRFSEDWGKDAPEYFQMLDELNTSFFHIVRKSGGNNAERPLVLSTVTASPSQARLDELYKTISTLKDKHIIATFHYYGFYPFSVNLAGKTTFDEDAKRDLIEAFDRTYDTFSAKGIPVVVGEIGLLGFDKSYDTIERGEILKYFDFINYYAKEKKFTLMLWDNGQHFNRRTLQWNDPTLYEVMMADKYGRSSIADKDYIFIKKDEPIIDADIALQLNGNTLQDIKIGDKILASGTDYELNEEKLVIKSSLLETLITKEYGVIANLVCTFSAGAKWEINVINYDTPILKNADGLDSLFAIPTLFHGDRLATMEAVYTSGGNAGPSDWTSFKEFNQSFSPAYDASEIKLTKAFFEQVKDGEIKLNMHFWSGEIIPYTITKTGSNVIGLSSTEEQKDAAKKEETVDEPSIQTAANAESDREESLTPLTNSQSPAGNNVMLYIIIAIIAAAFVLIGIYRMRKANSKHK
ncbi:cellulase family glycosylhydrolase [Paenibacillus castaneae]|uniref:cellulase family glycosylhydrolase n=1 Tax=Paenibacillus castaneae TaxID=474957 RepID=UPI000C99D7BE|nr:cellulase family glycosylhydrolase [Paenibacillus castaneae]